MTSLMNVDCKFMWDQKYEEVLNLELSDSYDVYSDASKNGFGCMLLLNGKVFMFVLRKWKTYEVSYSTHELDLATIMLL